MTYLPKTRRGSVVTSTGRFRGLRKRFVFDADVVIYRRCRRVLVAFVGRRRRTRKKIESVWRRAGGWMRKRTRACDDGTTDVPVVGFFIFFFLHDPVCFPTTIRTRKEKKKKRNAQNKDPTWTCAGRENRSVVVATAARRGVRLFFCSAQKGVIILIIIVRAGRRQRGYVESKISLRLSNGTPDESLYTQND